MSPEPQKTPIVSVIVPSVNGVPLVFDTLEALAVQTARGESEVLLLDRMGETTRQAVGRRFPWVRIIAAEPDTTIPELRRRGLAAARGEIIAFLEDHCVPAPDWLAEMIDCHRRLPHAAISGAVENGSTTSANDWAFFLCEYSALAPPLPEGEDAPVAGNCAGYKRTALDAVGGLDDRWEGFLHQRLVAAGFRAYCNPRLRVEHRISFPIGTLLAQRFHYARSYAAMRLALAGRPVRWAYAAAALCVLPFLVFGRILRDVARKPHLVSPLLRALPMLIALCVVWGAAEAAGAVAGPGGSLEKVR